MKKLLLAIITLACFIPAEAQESGGKEYASVMMKVSTWDVTIIINEPNQDVVIKELEVKDVGNIEAFNFELSKLSSKGYELEEILEQGLAIKSRHVTAWMSRPAQN